MKELDLNEGVVSPTVKCEYGDNDDESKGERV